eukprot:gb/GECG01000494.1/.p1 GENE.gb/GECG01000494.1/~~gb/GECG01000494.1/.p1  ORF type:complete len:115 (+),score=7.09 gb/GECG01000494.1/:1-345(+)
MFHYADCQSWFNQTDQWRNNENPNVNGWGFLIWHWNNPRLRLWGRSKSLFDSHLVRFVVLHLHRHDVCIGITPTGRRMTAAIVAAPMDSPSAMIQHAADNSAEILDLHVASFII